MMALRFLSLDESTEQACVCLAQAVRAQLAENAAIDMSDLDCTVMTVQTLNAASVAQAGAAISVEGCDRARCMLVFDRHTMEALRSALAVGIGDVIEQSSCSAAVIAARLGCWARIDAAIAQPMVRDNLVGSSAAWIATLRTVAESALFSTAPVLLIGPTGTGKELLARLLHSLDTRPRKRDLMIVDCTTLSRDLAGSELFGHERGAFTGANSEREGAIACADGGTLFLDEVGELPLELQAQFLRVLQEKAYRRVGSTVWRRADFRLVCATNRDLPSEVAVGRFRADLYHRIAAITCITPSLVERHTDISILARHFAGGRATLSAALNEYLQTRSYPGNVRELNQLILACLRRYSGAGPLCLGSLPDDEIRRWNLGKAMTPMTTASDQDHLDEFVRKALQANVGLKELGRLVEAAAVRIALAESRSITAAAQWLGVTPRALHLRRAAERE